MRSRRLWHWAESRFSGRSQDSRVAATAVPPVTVSLDLRYYDTNLSKENCYIYTGATDAVAGGLVDPLRNPEGLRSRWCSATFVAKLVFSTN